MIVVRSRVCVMLFDVVRLLVPCLPINILVLYRLTSISTLSCNHRFVGVFDV